MTIPRMVINMNEARLCKIEQIEQFEQFEQFLSASAQIDFTAHGDDLECHAHNQHRRRADAGDTCSQ